MVVSVVVILEEINAYLVIVDKTAVDEAIWEHIVAHGEVIDATERVDVELFFYHLVFRQGVSAEYS